MERERKPGNLQEEPLPVKRELISKGKRVLARGKALQDKISASIKTRESAIAAHNRDITSIVYRGEPFIYDFLNARREMHGLIPTVQTLCRQGVITGVNLLSLEKNDLFAQKFKGLSFIDIEHMEVDPQTHELAPEDIQRINRMFRAKVFSRFAKDKSVPFLVESLTYFASQQWIHPEIGVPISLKKFHENSTSYFDYYTSFLTDFKRDSQNEDTMLFILLRGGIFQQQLVAIFLQD